MATINFDEISSQNFDALPEDRYPLECIEAELAESKAKNQKITAAFKIIDGDFKNRRIWHDFSLVPAALFNLKNYFEAAGIDVAGKEIEPEDIPALILETQTSAFLEKTMYNKKAGNKAINWGPVNADKESTLFE